MSERIEEIRWRAFASGNPSDDTCALLAEIDRLTAELAAERAAHDLEKRAHERTWKHKAKMIDERDAAIRERDDAVRQAGIECAAKHEAIRERDARPNISRADAATVTCVVSCLGEDQLPHIAARIEAALRAHAAGVDAPRVDAVCPHCERGWVISATDLARRCRECHGTGRTEGGK